MLNFVFHQICRKLILESEGNKEKFNFNSLSDIVWNDKIFLSQQIFEFFDARDVHEFVLELLADHGLEEEPDHLYEGRWMDHVKLLQIFLEVPVEFFVRVPEEGERRFGDVFEALMEVSDDVVVLHILFHRLDNEVDENVGVEVFPLGKATRVNGNDGLAVLVSSDVIDKLPLTQVHSDGVFIYVWRLQLFFVVVRIQIGKI